MDLVHVLQYCLHRCVGLDANASLGGEGGGSVVLVMSIPPWGGGWSTGGQDHTCIPLSLIFLMSWVGFSGEEQR